MQQNKEKPNIFVSKTANQWIQEAATMPEPVPLYDQLWFEGETAFLFGGTGTGKSLYAVQIAKEISESQPVLYFDFELSLIQFAKRYRKDDENGQYYNFPENFFRIEFAKDITYTQDELITEIVSAARGHQSKVLIIDNLTWLLAAGEKSLDAGNFMKEISRIKHNNGYSILIIGHTPKRDETRPMSVNDMSGSMMLSNFADTTFAIGKSAQNPNFRYIKQLKVRSSDLLYGYESVKVLQLIKDDDGFLGFYDDDTTTNEAEHLKAPTEDERTQKKLECQDLLKQKTSYTEIQKRLGLSKGVISKYKKQMEQDNNDQPLTKSSVATNDNDNDDNNPPF